MSSRCVSANDKVYVAMCQKLYLSDWHKLLITYNFCKNKKKNHLNTLI